MAPPRRARTLPLRTSAAYVAVGTGVSRVTGLLRFVALAWALGQTLLADSYNLANTTPNMLYDVVLGGVLSATFIPVFVDRLANREESEAFESISAVITVSVVVLGVTTVAALVAAPFLIDALTALDGHAHAGQLHQVELERHVATGFLRWFVIQIAAYGLFALAAALLNTRRRFVAVAWAPIVNNIVCIGILIWFGLWAGHGASLTSVETHHTELLLLGLGTSLGVVAQGLALIPSLRQADLGRLRWRWNLHDDALRAVTRLGGWTFGFVVANQIALFVVTILAGSVAGPDPVSSYTYAYAFFQLPYGIIAVTIMSVVTPDLAEKWSTGQETAFLRRMTGGLRAILALVIPSAVGMLLLARPTVQLLLGHGHSTPAETATTGAALAMFALGLPGFCAYLYFVRVLQSMQRTKVAFYLYLVENGLNVALALLLVHPLGVRGLALSLSISYTVAALLALATFHQWFGRLADHAEWSPLTRVILASIPMGIVVVVVSNVSGSTSFGALLVRVVGSVIAGGLTFAAVVIWLGRRHDARRPPPARDRAGVPRPVPAGPPGLRLHVDDEQRDAQDEQQAERSLVAVDPVETAEPGGVPEPVNAPALVRVHTFPGPEDDAPEPRAPQPEPEPAPQPATPTRRAQRVAGTSRWVGGRRRVDDAQPVDVGVVRRIGGTKDGPAGGSSGGDADKGPGGGSKSS
ncbi:MAG TPA: murein biosynthesis integral membrane protein MurJ [Acidimicrobiales bacterium]|nr:murein biosynthesis integral membrane protein MurJ [Acidimicrobiales bacterium]